MSSFTRLACGTLARLLMTSIPAAAQPAVPIRALSAPDATAEHFGNVFGVRQLSNGGVLVNDGIRRQLVILDSAFAKRTVIVDSVSKNGQSYGPQASPLIPHLADSSLFVDGQSISLLVIDPAGRAVRVMSAPSAADFRYISSSASGVDAHGNLLYRSPIAAGRAGHPGALSPGAIPVSTPDSSAIVRANFEARTVDTVGRIRQNRLHAVARKGADEKLYLVMTVNPLTAIDEWAVLSDGTIAFVRGHDYHVDFLRPDGTTFSSSKLSFDEKRLTDEAKQALIDSARTAHEKALADSKAPPSSAFAALSAAMRLDPTAASGEPITVYRVGPAGPGAGTGMIPKLEFVPRDEIADYYPPIRAGAAKADLDGNLWILPTTSAQSKNGELVYDVVNNKGELYQRVRLPVGRSIAGFGHNGVVYLMYREATDGWTLERTRVLGNAH